MKEQLKEIYKELKEVGWKLQDNELADLSVRIYLSREISKERANWKTNQKPIEKSNPAKELATEKQKNYLKKAGYEEDVTKLSKAEAHILIEEYIKRSKGMEY